MLKKFGTGKVLDEEVKNEGSKEGSRIDAEIWTKKDQQELIEENKD